MPDQSVKVRRGQCPTHGVVDATKPVIAPWPFLVAIPRLIISLIRGWRCPTCGAKTTPV